MNETIIFAEQELKKYLRLMTGETGELTLSAGTDTGFAERCEIEVRGGKGSLVANSPRALLQGAYAFLRSCGCRFLRPDGEEIPKKSIGEINASFVFEPILRHRGITIEGAVSLENVVAVVDWAAKAGFNSYFTQFNTSYEFFSRWYEHANNPLLPKTPINGETAKGYIRQIVAEIKKRDFLYHAVGHGWTAACLGIEVNGWFTSDEELSDELRSMMAEIDGKRGFFKGKPLNTHLCYSNPAVRRSLAEKVVEYAKTHPEINVLHFWLADDFNNACECEECAKKRMSDWYVMILNQIDELLTKEGLDVKIVFLVYLELYWPPLTERIVNKDRFLMMFAPIFRSYTQSYADVEGWEARELVPYNKNKVEYSHDVGEYLAFHAAWKKLFDGECFDFDYHLMWDIARDFGGERLSEVLFEDIRLMPKMGMDGLMSCQIQRAFYPNGLPFYMMGRALSDGAASYREIEEEYYTAAFGRFAAFAKDTYGKIERDVSFAYGREEMSATEALPGFKRAKDFLSSLSKAFPSCLEEDSDLVKESMAILQFAVNHILRIVTVLILKIEGASEEEIEEANEERKRYFNEREMRFQSYVDGYLFNMVVDGLIDCEQTGIYGATDDRKEN